MASCVCIFVCGGGGGGGWQARHEPKALEGRRRLSSPYYSAGANVHYTSKSGTEC